MSCLLDLFTSFFEMMLKLLPEGNTNEILKENDQKYKKLKEVKKALDRTEEEIKWKKSHTQRSCYSQRDSYQS